MSFDSEDAGINYTDATWTENFKQLDVYTDKGINMEAKNNSYWWVNETKKAVYGNKLNKLEFRTDGVAKYSNIVNAKDYQIGGTPIMDKVNENIIKATTNYRNITLKELDAYPQEHDDECVCKYLIGSHWDENDIGYVDYYVSFYLLPNKTYILPTIPEYDSEAYHYVQGIELKFLNSYIITDKFKVILSLSSHIHDNVNNYPNLTELFIKLPYGVKWENDTVPSIEKDITYLLIIENNIAKLESYNTFKSYAPDVFLELDENSSVIYKGKEIVNVWVYDYEMEDGAISFWQCDLADAITNLDLNYGNFSIDFNRQQTIDYLYNFNETTINYLEIRNIKTGTANTDTFKEHSVNVTFAENFAIPTDKETFDLYIVDGIVYAE